MLIKKKTRIKSGSVAIIMTLLFIGACSDGSQQSKKQPPVLTAQISKSPLFESSEGWGPGFAKATGHGPGVVVGPGGLNPNVFAQQFPAKPNEDFKLIARASSVDKPKAMGRFQVNWTDSNDKFISASIKPFEVTSAEQTFEHYVVAPDGAKAGTLYVVGDGSEDIVRYTEMRVLGKGNEKK